MRHIQFTLIGLVITLLSATAAQASVIYNWHSTSPGPYVTATGGELVITDAAYRSGSIDENFRRANSPVVSASLSFSFTNEAGYIPDLSVHPGDMFADDSIPFVSALAFNDDGTLSGYLFLVSDSGSDEVEASGSLDDWTVYNYGSDYFGSELCGPPTCSGGSGYWQLSSGPVGVPEPPVWSLFSLGVLGLFSLLGLRRKA